jgi:hypothetical protein
VPRSTHVLINLAAEQNTDHWRKKCPPQEQAFLHTFLALKKVWRLTGRDPSVLILDFDFPNKSKNSELHQRHTKEQSYVNKRRQPTTTNVTNMLTATGLNPKRRRYPHGFNGLTSPFQHGTTLAKYE